jgi:hypothetical protein
VLALDVFQKVVMKENKSLCGLHYKISHMLQGKVQIFQITDKKFYPNYIEYSLHKPISYLQTSENRILVANQIPFSSYKVGDHLGISVEMVGWKSLAT